MTNHEPIGLTGCLAIAALCIGGLTGLAITISLAMEAASHLIWG